MTPHDPAARIHQIYATVGTGIFYFRDVGLHPSTLRGLWDSGYLIRVSEGCRTKDLPARYQINTGSRKVAKWIGSLETMTPLTHASNT